MNPQEHVAHIGCVKVSERAQVLHAHTYAFIVVVGAEATQAVPEFRPPMREIAITAPYVFTETPVSGKQARRERRAKQRKSK